MSQFSHWQNEESFIQQKCSNNELYARQCSGCLEYTDLLNTDFALMGYENVDTDGQKEKEKQDMGKE